MSRDGYVIHINGRKVDSSGCPFSAAGYQEDFDEATLTTAAARAGPKLRAALRYLLRREWPPRDDLPGAGDDLED